MAAVEGQSAAILNRFNDETYQLNNWNRLETTIKAAVKDLIPSAAANLTTTTTTEFQTLDPTSTINNNPNSAECLTLISHSIYRTSSDLLTLNQNLIRGRGVFCSACIEYQSHHHAACAAFIAVVNSNHPQIGHLLLRRLISDIKYAHARYNYASLTDLTKLLAHLINQRVAAESLGFELVNFFLYNDASPSDAIVTISVEFVQQCGGSLRKSDADSFDGVLDRLRELLRSRRNSSLYRDISDEDSKVKEIVQTISSLRSAAFRNAITVVPELNLVSEKDSVNYTTHSDISLLDDKIETEMELDVFNYNPDFFDANVAGVRAEIEFIITSAMRDGGIGTGVSSAVNQLKELKMKEVDDSDLDSESEICWMIVELCGQEYRKYYGELGRAIYMVLKTGKIAKAWKNCFKGVYEKIEEYEDEKKVENVARFFGDLMELDLMMEYHGSLWCVI